MVQQLGVFEDEGRSSVPAKQKFSRQLKIGAPRKLLFAAHCFKEARDSSYYQGYSGIGQKGLSLAWLDRAARNWKRL